MATPGPKDLATRDEVDQAINSLSDANWLRLHRFAHWRIRGLGRAAAGRAGEDLLSEALVATVLGAETQGAEGRRWNKQVDFPKHLTEAMRSISSHWSEQYCSETPVLESDVIRIDEEGGVRNALDQVSDGQPDSLREIVAKQELARIMGKFKDDDEAILVLEGLREGWSRAEFSSLGMSTAQYDTALKRIRYALEDER